MGLQDYCFDTLLAVVVVRWPGGTWDYYTPLFMPLLIKLAGSVPLTPVVSLAEPRLLPRSGIYHVKHLLVNRM